jgi:gluconolactonase
MSNNETDTNRLDSNIIAGGATPKLISKQFSFTEGPAVDRRGNIFFTDQPNNKIWKYDTEGNLSVFLEEAGRSNGMYFDKEGNLVSCADEENQLWSISPQKKITVLLSDFSGQKLNGPNDLWIAPNGNIYFTDPYYQRSYWKRTKPDLEGQDVYLLHSGQKTAVRLLDHLQQPNGIVGTPDGRYLYVADIKGGKTFRYTIRPDGTLGDETLVINMGSDGMTLDNRGNLYLTGEGVTVVDPTGKKIAHIPLPGWTSNVAFGGPEKNILFITASEAIYTLAMNVHGVE